MLAPDRTDRESGIGAWLIANTDRLALSVVTLAEISRGVSMLEVKGATAKAARYRLWLDLMAARFADRIVAVDATIALLAGEFDGRALGAAFQLGLADALIAATALIRGCPVLTLNVRHFEALNVEVLDAGQIFT
ncbi:MAG: PIN domain-containing protein [Hyphomonadaceae bacterium]|jgi:hypothetical protein|nr:PIN domain-containing protein [Hyphomonadaceae bacterium]